MKLSLVGLAFLVPHSLASTPVTNGVQNLDPFVPVSSASLTEIVLNGTRYRLDNISLKNNSNPTKVRAIAVVWPDRATLFHPAFWSYFIHFAFQALTAIGVLLCVTPCKKSSCPDPLRIGAIITTVLLVLAVLCWPLSWITNQPIGKEAPGTMGWWFMTLKSLIVNIAPTVPMMYGLIFNPSAGCRQCLALWTYLVLWLNVAWTLLALSQPAQRNAVSLANGVCGASLMISLPVHICALIKRGVTPSRGRALAEVKGDIILGYGTSLSWLVCYTAWNATFVFTTLVVSCTLQDIFFWAMMLFFYYWSDAASPIENYFFMARPLSLSAYIASTDWTGFLEFFRSGPPFKLDLTRHAFFLFIALANAVYSLYVLYWEFCLLFDCCGAGKYFQNTFGFKDDGEDYDEMDSDPEDVDMDAGES